MQRPWRGVAYWFAPHGLLGLIEQNTSPGWIHHGELGNRMLTEKTGLSGWPVVHLLGWWQTWGPSSHRESWGWWKHSRRIVGAQLEDPASSHLGPGWLFYLRFFLVLKSLLHCFNILCWATILQFWSEWSGSIIMSLGKCFSFLKV